MPTINTRRSKLGGKDLMVAEPTPHGQGHCTRRARSGEKAQPVSQDHEGHPGSTHQGQRSLSKACRCWSEHTPQPAAPAYSTAQTSSLLSREPWRGFLVLFGLLSTPTCCPHIPASPLSTLLHCTCLLIPQSSSSMMLFLVPGLLIPSSPRAPRSHPLKGKSSSQPGQACTYLHFSPVCCG